MLRRGRSILTHTLHSSAFNHRCSRVDDKEHDHGKEQCSWLALMQELQALIKYIQINKASDSDWFTITSSKDGVHWSGKCWYASVVPSLMLRPALLHTHHILHLRMAPASPKQCLRTSSPIRRTATQVCARASEV